MKNKLIVFFGILFIYVFAMNLQVSASYFENLGSAQYGQYRVGRFKVDGRWAFCVDHHKGDPIGTNGLGNGEILNNESVRAILYYGFAGNENQVGDSDAAIVATSLALDAIINPNPKNDTNNRKYIPGYIHLMNHARAQDAPSMESGFSTSNSETYIEGDHQRSETIRFNADHRNSINIPVQSGTILWVDGTPFYGGSVSIRGGQSFWLTAPLNCGETFSYKGIKTSLKLYNSLMYIPRDPSRQRISRMIDRDPVTTNDLSIHFHVRERNINIEYRDVLTGQVLGSRSEKRIIGSNFDIESPDSYGKNGDGTYRLISDKHARGQIQNNDITIIFYYDLFVPTHIRHIDKRTHAIISESWEDRKRETQYKYSSRRDLKTSNSKYIYRPVSNQEYQGRVSNSRLNFDFYYDVPLMHIGLEKVQIYTRPADKGLELKTNFNNSMTIYDISNQDMMKASVTFSIYDDNDRLIDSKKVSLRDFKSNMTFEIKSKYLKENQCKMYTVKIEKYDSNEVIILNQSNSLGTLGYTSSRKNVSVNAKDQTTLFYKGVVMTEHVWNQKMKEYFEEINIKFLKIQKDQTGYGFEMPIDFEYKNDVLATDNTEIFMTVPESLVDNFIPYKIEKEKAVINLQNIDEKKDRNTIRKKFALPHVNVEYLTGNLFSDEQIKNKDSNRNMQYELVDGGRKFYTPIWAEIGKYLTQIKSEKPIGVHEISIEINDEIELCSYMICHMDSPTKDLDAMLYVFLDEIDPVLPDSWSEENKRIFIEEDPKYIDKIENSVATIKGNLIT